MMSRKTLSVVVIALLLLCAVCKTTHELREPVDLPLDDIPAAVVVDAGTETDGDAGALGTAEDGGAVDEGAASGEPQGPESLGIDLRDM